MVLCQTTPPPCVLVGREPCSVCQEEIELELKIQELQDKRRIIRARINAEHDPFNFRLPPELASLIFSLSMGKEDYEPGHSTLRKLPTQFLLGSVSRWWRQLACSTPQLWSTISFTLVKKNTNVLPPLQFINNWLQLSGSLPLTLWITENSAFDFPRETCRPVIDSLTRHLGRWYDVTLDLDQHYFNHFRAASPPSNLYNLEISSCEVSDIDDPPTPHFSIPRPSPTRLTLRSFPLSAIDIEWVNITCLTLAFISLDECIEAIKSAPLLESCKLLSLDPLTDEDSPAFHSKHLFRHTGLRKLTLEGIEVDLLIVFLELMDFPSIEELSYELENETEVECLISFLNRSRICLKRLALLINEDIRGALKKLLDAVPDLSNLECEFSSHMPFVVVPINDFLQRLSSSPPILPGGSPGFLPNLQSLVLRIHVAGTPLWQNVPPIFSLSHRKPLNFKIETKDWRLKLDDGLLSILELIDQGFKICILGFKKPWVPVRLEFDGNLHGAGYLLQANAVTWKRAKSEHCEGGIMVPG